MALYSHLGREDTNDGEGLILHARGEFDYMPMQTNSSEPVEFELDNFKGKCIFLHRPRWSYDSADTNRPYPYRQHFHGRKRLWEWRLQGRFKRKPGTLYCGIELEEYVPVNMATRTMMRGILPLVQRTLQCAVHHEIGDPEDPDLRPVVVAPVWAMDSTLIHNNPADVPDLASPSLPAGLGRKAARQFWETLWNGGGPSWEEPMGGPTFTFAVWGPSQLLDLRAWVFRKLPLTWGRDVKMEPFCGRQPVHAVVYELCEDGKSDHRQERKVYSADMRFMTEELWSERSMGEEARRPAGLAPALDDMPSPRVCRSESFCSAVSHTSSLGSGDERDGAAADTQDLLGSPTAQLPIPLVGTGSNERAGSRFLVCCRRRRRRVDPSWLELV